MIVKKTKALVCELPELAADTARQRIQLFPAPGDYVHPVGGEFTLTDDTLAEYAADIDTRGDSIALDYDHSPEKGQGTRASGWFVAGTAQVEAAGVFADVEWTPAAAEAIRNREYRFISPTFAFAHKTMDGRVIREPKLVGAALTNRPFFNVMEPLAADDVPLTDTLAVEEVFGATVADTLTEVSADAAAALIAAAQMKSMSGRMPMADPGYRKDGKARFPLSTPEECTAAWKAMQRKQTASTYTPDQLSRIKARIRRAATKLGVTVGADATTKEKTMELTEAIAADLGVAVDADDETILAAITKVAAEKKELEAKVPGDGTVTMTAAEVADLRASAARSDKAVSDALATRKKTVLDGAVAGFKIAAADLAFFDASFDRDPDGTEKFLAEKPAVLALKPAGTSASVDVGDDTVEADLTPVTVDGAALPVDVDRAKIAAATDALIRKAGKNPSTVTADEYAAFAAQVYAAA